MRTPYWQTPRFESLDGTTQDMGNPRGEGRGLDDEDGFSSMNTIAQLQRRREAKLRLVPLNSPDERLDEPLKIKVNPYNTLKMLHMGVSFSFSLDELRSAWHIASPDEQEHIEYVAEQLQQKELVA